MKMLFFSGHVVILGVVFVYLISLVIVISSISQLFQ